MKRISITAAALGTAFVLTACAGATQRSTTVESGGDVSASSAVVTPTNNRTIPAGARLTATLDQSLGTKISKVGDTFTATVQQTLYATNGSVVVPAGAKIDGHVTAIDDSDNATEPALIRLTFDRIRFSGNTYPFSAAIVQSSAVQTSEQSSTERTRKIIIGGAVGAAIGGLLSGGDLDKIIIGGAIGAAAGQIVSLGTEVNATLPAGSQMTLQATQTTTVR
jgi:formylmethanofuran dehydrogenase subunit C